MHIGVSLAVEADDKQSAIAAAESFSYDVDWSDWSEHEGRWQGVIPGGVLAYNDDPEKFNELVDNARKSTADQLEVLLGFVGDLTIKELCTNEKYIMNLEKMNQHGDIDDFLAIYRAKKALGLVSDSFTSDMFFYDTNSNVETRGFLDERIQKAPEKQFLVMWDFHF